MILVLKYFYVIFFLKRKSSLQFGTAIKMWIISKLKCIVQENFNIYPYNSFQLLYFNQLAKN